jgi:transcriptional regulator with XRE-family HTH domain
MRRHASKANPGAINHRSNALFKGSELLRQCGIEFESELSLGNCCHDMFPVLSVSGEKKSDNVFARVDIRPNLVNGNPGLLRKRNDPLCRDATDLLPLANDLRAGLQHLSQTILTTQRLGRGLDELSKTGIVRDGYGFTLHDATIHPELNILNPQMIDHVKTPIENPLMVDKSLHPARFRSFAKWLEAVISSGYSQKELAGIAHTSPQMFSKWLNGSRPKPAHVDRLARRMGVEYLQLHQLAEDIRIIEPVSEGDFSTQTEMGARLARKWEELDEPARTAIFDLVETLCAQQLALKSRKSDRPV